jgi:hypothetical protein
VSAFIEIIKNKARHNLIDAKYQQMAFGSVPTTLLFGIWSNKSNANLEGITVESQTIAALVNVSKYSIS